ncbi:MULTISPECIES: substrate-binding domain-containing protein [unclassified Methylosinus]|uniref:substrate-binding domain-containing protein n=1 Tax=unclassified Methylosinus TaxID=2624500 RepID=UPI0004AC7FF3|nr:MULTISPECIES: substrate-binding domain-containing protein [unclassified Methylosinus]
MSALSFSKALRNGSSALALSTLALIGAQPALATDGIFGGGSTLASLAERQLSADYYTASSSSVLLLYAGIGSGSGQRVYISNDPSQGFRGAGLDPAANPDYTLGFTSYPYPRIDFGASDSPLPSNFVSGYTTTVYLWDQINHTTAANGSTSFPTADVGDPIQLPLFEAPVAIAVNLPAVDQSTGTTTAGGTTWTIKSQFSTTAAGGRIQLSTAQVCAIFSGLVTDWNSTATIPTLSSTGVAGTEGFADANTWHAASTAGTPGTGGGTAYASASKQIKIVYRSDGSGTSFIFTNYLKTVCPLLDPSNTYGYVSIFSTSALPNNNFTQLINKVTAYGRSLNTTGADGSDAVAAAIGNTSANYGYIGYLSNDFVAPYNPSTATTIPHAASLQNDYQRSAGVTHPGVSSTNFIAATPTSADAAWGVLSLPASANFADWNVYAQTFPATTYLPGTGVSVDITGRSKLPLAPATGAYSLVGTAYLYVYSCYGVGRDSTPAATRVSDLLGYLKWHYGLTAGNAATITANNGFKALSTGAGSWAQKIGDTYLGTAASSATITAYDGFFTDGCASVSGTGAQ